MKDCTEAGGSTARKPSYQLWISALPLLHVKTKVIKKGVFLLLLMPPNNSEELSQGSHSSTAPSQTVGRDVSRSLPTLTISLCGRAPLIRSPALWIEHARWLTLCTFWPFLSAGMGERAVCHDECCYAEGQIGGKQCFLLRISASTVTF